MTTPQDTDRSKAVQALVAVAEEHFGGDWAELLDAAAEEGKIAVAALDKSSFAEYFTNILGTTMTEEHWAKIAGDLYDYEVYLARRGFTTEYIAHVLTRHSAYDDTFDADHD